MIYASKSRRGFFDDAASGPRLIDVPDPSWDRPLVSVIVHPGEGLGEFVNETDEPIEVMTPDLDAVHPMVTVVNPDCRLPDDAIEVSRELRDACLAAPSIDWSGELPSPGSQQPPAPSAVAAALRAEAQAALHASDVTLLRCFENNIALPAAWKSYRAALRSIVTNGTGSMPTRPAYPAGT